MNRWKSNNDSHAFIKMWATKRQLKPNIIQSVECCVAWIGYGCYWCCCSTKIFTSKAQITMKTLTIYRTTKTKTNNRIPQKYLYRCNMTCQQSTLRNHSNWIHSNILIWNRLKCFHNLLFPHLKKSIPLFWHFQFHRILTPNTSFKMEITGNFVSNRKFT